MVEGHPKTICAKLIQNQFLMRRFFQVSHVSLLCYLNLPTNSVLVSL